MIGGAGYSYPKYFISKYEDKNMDVVEIDGEITEIAKNYLEYYSQFGFDELNIIELYVNDKNLEILNKLYGFYENWKEQWNMESSTLEQMANHIRES